MRAKGKVGRLQKHGADVYDRLGRVRALLDFSDSVAQSSRPKSWKRRLLGLLEGSARYPQQHSYGLSRRLEGALGLRQGSALVGNGSSECLELAARAEQGRTVALEEPSFGGYGPKLERAKAKVLRLGQGPKAWDWVKQRRVLAQVDAYWMANPSNPAGRVLGKKELLERLRDCRRAGVRFLLDESVASQALAPLPGMLSAVAAEPGAVIVRSLSKGVGLPGLRLGCALGHPQELARLRPYQDPWTVNAIAQSAGAWALQEEADHSAEHRRALSRLKGDLAARLAPWQASGRLKVLDSDTGYFLVELAYPGANAGALALALEQRGLLVRDCSSYGAWGRRYLRLNPRAPKDNAKLAAAFRRLWGRA